MRGFPILLDGCMVLFIDKRSADFSSGILVPFWLNRRNEPNNLGNSSYCSRHHTGRGYGHGGGGRKPYQDWTRWLLRWTYKYKDIPEANSEIECWYWRLWFPITELIAFSPALPQTWFSSVLTTSSIMLHLVPRSLPSHQIPLLLFLMVFHLLNNLPLRNTPFHRDPLYITITIQWIHCFHLFLSHKVPLNLLYLPVLPPYRKMRALVHPILVTMNDQITPCKMILTPSWSI